MGLVPPSIANDWTTGILPYALVYAEELLVTQTSTTSTPSELQPVIDDLDARELLGVAGPAVAHERDCFNNTQTVRLVRPSTTLQLSIQAVRRVFLGFPDTGAS